MRKERTHIKIFSYFLILIINANKQFCLFYVVSFMWKFTKCDHSSAEFNLFWFFLGLGI